MQLSVIPNVDCFQQVYLGQDEKEAELLIVSPNPSNGVFEFKNLASTEIELTISNSQGRIIFVEKSIGGFKVDLTAQSSGTYIANISSDSSIQTIRLVKM